MELEKVIEKLEQMKNSLMIEEFDYGWVRALAKAIKYIKEESIPKAVVEEKIKQLKEQSGDNVFHIQQTINSNIRLLQEILNKGE